VERIRGISNENGMSRGVKKREIGWKEEEVMKE